MIPSIGDATCSLLTMIIGPLIQDILIYSLVIRNCTSNIVEKITSVLHPVSQRILKISFFRLTLIAFSKQKESLGTSLDLLSNIK